MDFDVDGGIDSRVCFITVVDVLQSLGPSCRILWVGIDIQARPVDRSRHPEDHDVSDTAAKKPTTSAAAITRGIAVA